jgi:hypothetical protein
MNFDPAIAAHQALRQAEAHGELGMLAADILEAEEIFSTDQGQEAKQAYEQLQSFGRQLPRAKWFQEFLIFITWQRVTEGPLARHFQHGLDACNRFLVEFKDEIEGTPSLQQVLDIRESFQGGLGLEEDDVMPELDEDAFKGGD